MNILITLLVVAVIVTSVLYASIFEWCLHKFVMHGKPFRFEYAFLGHQEVHHRNFGPGPSYTLENHPPEKQEENKKTIPMAWWNWIVLLIIATLPVVIICFAFLSVWWPTAVTSIIFLLYYLTYEYFHWCMHDPMGRWFENKSWFKWIDKYHRIHHARFNKNLNVVLPFADWLFRSLVK